MGKSDSLDLSLPCFGKVNSDVQLFFGRTPYMFLSEESSASVEELQFLKPKPSYDELMHAVKKCNNNEDKIFEEIYNLLGKKNGALHHLRLVDMLYCKGGCSEADLKSRQIEFFEKITTPLLRRSCNEPALDRKGKDLVFYVLNQTIDHPCIAYQRHQNVFQSFVRKKNDLESLIAEGNKIIEEKYIKER